MLSKHTVHTQTIKATTGLSIKGTVKQGCEKREDSAAIVTDLGRFTLTDLG